MFSWAMVVACSLWLLTLPALLANLLLIFLDLRLGRPSDFGVGGNQWFQVQWVFQQPQVFACAIPVLGVVGDVVATAAGVRQQRRGLMFVGIGAFGVLSFGAWAQSFFDDEVATNWLFIGMGVAILLPLLVLFGGWATTMRDGKPKVSAATAGALLAVLLLLLAGLASALYVIEPLDLQQTLYPQYGVLALVLGSVTVGGAAALAFWAPKIWGRFPQSGLGYLAVLAGFGGSAMAGIALVVNGFQAKFDGLADAADFLNGVAAAGFALLAVAVLLTIVNLLIRGGAAGDDPWQGQTLEWLTTSPPPVGNFGELAMVTSAEPALDARQPTGESDA
jgi:heme/copper-type cytochrome/quinol oxidase subunit 1